MLKAVRLSVNGTPIAASVEPRMTLADFLRDECGLTGTHLGCEHGACGACTVLVDGQRVLGCLTLAAQCAGREVTTIEGLADERGLHPLQRAFIEHDGFQCGYCTPGQICSAVGMAAELARGVPSVVTADLGAEHASLTHDELRERMSGNICRCAAYPNIVAAVKQAKPMMTASKD